MAVALTGSLRRRRLSRTRVYLIAGPDSRPGGGWEEATEAALASGVVGMVQLRDKHASDAEFAVRARWLRARAHAASALLILDDRVHLVAETRADGAHVGEDDLDPREARRRIGPRRLLGVSAHSADEVAAAPGLGANYAGLGPCFPTTTKALVRRPRGARLVAEAACVATLPVFPIGGVTVRTVRRIAAAGARRAAVGAGILAADDPAAAARAIHAALAGR